MRLCVAFSEVGGVHPSTDALAASYQPEEKGKKEDESAAAGSGEFGWTTSHRAQTQALAVGQAQRFGTVGGGGKRSWLRC